jgi:broad specificity phosphatase PhoE
MKKIIFSLLLTFIFLPLVARTIYVTRHGQVGDRNYFDKSVKEIKLTPLGIEQAKLLAEYLTKKLKFNGTIYVSPLYRTIETGIFTANLIHKKVILEPGIQEIAPQKTPRGMTLKEIQARFPNQTIPGKTFIDKWRLSFENNAARQKRVGETLDRILAESTGDLLLVGHGGIVGNLVVEFNKRLAPGAKEIKGIAWNCSLFTFELNDQNQVVKSSYTTKYMDDSKVTNNFRKPKIPRPNDPRYGNKSRKAATLLRSGERLLLIARHCQATGQKTKDSFFPIEGDGGITTLGIEQSMLLGKCIKKLKFKGSIFASPYYRTTATACEIAKITGSKVYPDGRFQERVSKDGGNLPNGGASLEQLKKLYPSQIANDAKLPNNWMLKQKEEYTGTHQQRLQKAIEELLKTKSGDILIVSHGGAIGALLRIMQKKCGIKSIKGTIWNCALFKFAVDAKGNCRYLGYDISFMPQEKVTSNFKTSLVKQNSKKKKDFKSDIDYKL